MKTKRRLILISTVVAAMNLALIGCNKSPEATTATLPTPTSKASDNVADADVTTNVKTALLRDATLSKFDVSVVTLKGDVRLIGVLDTQAQIDAAIKVARSADGVHSIHDELVLKK